MKYLKIFTDFKDKMELLSDAERGRLFTAMLEYADSGAELELRGNERFIWKTVKSEIDRQAENYDVLCKRNKENATSRYQSQPLATSRSEWQEDKDKDKDKDKEKERKKTTPNGVAKESSRFLPPTLEEVTAYCRERNNGVNPEKFINYYSSNGWMVGRNKMKDWKAAVRNWEAKDGKAVMAPVREQGDDRARLKQLLGMEN